MNELSMPYPNIILDAAIAYGTATFDFATALESGADTDQAAARTIVDETLATLRALLNRPEH